jgi:DNA-binding NarL/FixJ family response regulator
LSSLDELIGPEGVTLGEILEDEKGPCASKIENEMTIDDIKGLTMTDREKEVLTFLLKGYTVREAAAELGVSHVMVVKYKKSIVRKWRKKRLPKA